jgi:DNA-binding MarR family transcriptional regulator
MLSRTVSRLQAINLVTRNPGPSDQRAAFVTATATGAQVHQRIQEQQAAVVSRCLEHLGSSQEIVLLDRSLGMATSRVPARVSKSRCR